MRKSLKNNSEVAHIWASQTQSSGKCGSMFFENETIYSYGTHFAMAKFHTMPNGEKCVLFNADTYSITTSKHQSYTHRAISSEYTIFTIPDDLWDNYDSAIKWYSERVAEKFALSKRAREYALMHYESAITLIGKMKLYAEYNNKSVEYVLSEDEQQIIARAKQQESVCAERTKIREEKQKQKRLAETEELNNICGGDIEEYWHRHGSLPVGYSQYTHLTNTLCRIVDGDVVTSQGARVPVEHVKRVMPVIIRCRQNKTEWVANGEQIKIGHFSFNKISVDGDIHIGCHYILWSEVAYIARQLNIMYCDKI